ncbi:MAG: CCA tRNA nucleotidyltransferase [Bdellovibrionales bacterium]
MSGIPTSLDPIGPYAWLREEGLRRIFAALRDGGGEARVVGGAVRDALLGHEVREVDLATTLEPARVTELLAAAGLRIKPTGLAHGTVTAVFDGKGYEITTLRRDVETDGRHAKVAFTDDWRTDAARRDFTMNAIYADASGKLYDYHHGQEDLAAGIVRFIGDPRQRIQEDVLRILRFFRFNAWFAKREIDSEGLSACRELAPLMSRLSIERVARELLKLFRAPNPLSAWRCMSNNGIAGFALPEAETSLVRFEALIDLEMRVADHDPAAPARLFPSAGLMRLASVLPADANICEAVGRRLKLSNHDTEALTTFGSLPTLLAQEKLTREAFRRALYRHGDGLALASALLACSCEVCLSDRLGETVAEALAWNPIAFPVRGKDLAALGLAEGPRMGELLRKIEDWWIARDFRPTREECLAQAKILKGGLW